MSSSQTMTSRTTTAPESIPNGPDAAAILAAGIGCAALGVLALSNDAFPAINRLLNFYRPSGGLSGVSTVAVVIWLVSWYILSRNWKARTVAMARVNLIAFGLLAVGVLLTFPPVMDFIQGR